MTCEGFSGAFMKRQSYHSSPGWALIMKRSALLFLQLWKLKEIKCLYFLDQTSFEGDMSCLTFCDWWFDNEHKNKIFEIIKSSYLSNLVSEQKNKGTLYSSTLKVGEIKVHLFSWLELILVSYGNFVIAWRNWKTPHKSQNDKKLISQLNDLG